MYSLLLLKDRRLRALVTKIAHFSVVFFLFLGFGCSDYTARTRSALDKFLNRDFDGALKDYEKESKSKKDRLLYLIDKGIVLHTAGKYAESIKVLQEADDLADKIDYISISKELASLFTNERVRTYKGEAFERVLINVYKAIGYTMLGEIEEALVECRRINEKLEKFNKILKTDQKGPFPRYISGLLYEAGGEINDAYVDYKLAHKIFPDFKYLASDLLRLSRELGFLDDYNGWQRVFGGKGSRTKFERRTHGELVIILETGLSPEKESSERRSAAQIIPVPVYVDRPTGISHAEVYVGDEYVSRTYVLSDIGKLSKAYLDKRIAAYIARGVARLAIKEGAAVAVGKYVDEDVGILVGIMMLFTNRADLRSSLTLPEKIQLARVFLKKGVHNITVKFRNKYGGYTTPPKIFEGVEIKSGKRTFLNYRTFR